MTEEIDSIIKKMNERYPKETELQNPFNVQVQESWPTFVHLSCGRTEKQESHAFD